MQLNLRECMELAFQHGLSRGEWLKLTPYEFSLYLKAKNKQDQVYWENLLYILTGKKNNQTLNLDELEKFIEEDNQ